MKLTAQTRYALRILLDIADGEGGGPRTIKEIAASQGLSEKFVSRIVPSLRKAGLVAVSRGARGGLKLGRFPEKITLLDIVEATDGAVSLVHCLARPGVCPRQGRCAAENAWARVNEALAAALRRTTLEQVAEEQRKLAPPGPSEPDYCI